MANPKKPVLAAGIRVPAATGAILAAPLAPGKATVRAGKRPGIPAPGSRCGKLCLQKALPWGRLGSTQGSLPGAGRGRPHVPGEGRLAALGEHGCPIPPAAGPDAAGRGQMCS